MQKKARAAYALQGWNLLRKGSWSLVTPWASQAARKRKKAMRMEIQVNSDVIVVSVWNQLKTVAAPALTVMYVRRLIEAVIKIHQRGIPFFVHHRSCFGACPFCASANR